MGLERLAFSCSQNPRVKLKMIGSSSFPDLYFRGFLVLFLLYFHIKVILRIYIDLILHGNKWEYHYC